MTLPDRSEDYIHRVGRVGRADTMGLAISLVSSVPEKVYTRATEQPAPCRIHMQPTRMSVHEPPCVNIT
ncbi:ATP-dependent RNA helicase DDX1 [Micractinium conductrix]|uniref:ATP-dependent RNA helicase DDX1 n=1 Tax=Micractinium conductrix TaxID=554055 RepID=A0A2P6V7G7_9CHLO|nr:ATP-dependent RNA helicase DDX1 [Micractinium conductrix]|eukprot:PSC70027.1 ATP-dependent RNA helicase DDX1 [Micractinium conductrix]